MAEQITTAEELQALPVGSVAADRTGSPWMKITATVWATPETGVFASESIARQWSPFTVVYRPDRNLLAEAEARGAQEAASHTPAMLREAQKDGARAAWSEALAAADALVRELTANIPLSPPDPAWDPNDEFRRCAVDRAERAKRWRQNLRARVEQAGGDRG